MTRFIAETLIAIGQSVSVSLIAKATLVCLAAFVIEKACRRSRSSARHLIFVATFGALLILPIAALVLPDVVVLVPATASSTPPPVSSRPQATVVTDDVSVPIPFGGAVDLRASESSQPLAQTLWLMGVGLFLIPVVAGLWQLRRVRRRALPWSEGQALVAALAGEAGVRRHVDVRCDDGISGPLTCGLRRPTILLPIEARQWERDALRRAILHELEHVRRGDWLTHCAARTVCVLYRFHPLVWIAWRQLRFEAERACDDAVLEREDAAEYASLLVTVAERRMPRSAQPLLGMAGRGDLSRRVAAVLDRHQSRGPVHATSVIASLAVAVAVSASVAPMTVESAPSIEVQRLLPRSAIAQSPSKREVGLAVASEAIVRRTSHVVMPQDDTPKAIASPELDSAPDDRQVKQADPKATGIGRMIVFLYDVSSLSAEELRKVTAVALEFANGMSGSDMVAVVTIGTRLNVLSDFTANREDLRAVLQSPDLLNGTSPDAGALAAGQSRDAAASSTGVTPAPASAVDTPTNVLRLRALTTLCETLAPIQQRKTVLYFNAGMNRTDGDTGIDLRATTNACNRANVSIYPVDARGIPTVLPSVDAGRPSGTDRFLGRQPPPDARE